MRRLVQVLAFGVLAFTLPAGAAEPEPAAPAVTPADDPDLAPEPAPSPADDPDLAPEPAPTPASDPDLAPDPARPGVVPAGAAPADPDLTPPAATAEDGDAIADVDSFAIELEALGLEVQISGYGDVVFQVDTHGDNTFDVSHFNPIVSARLSQLVRAELELEFEHGGESQKVEYAFVDFAVARAFNLRAGKILVPIGRFNAVLHPSFRWRQISRPAMFRDVIPSVWADVGLQAYGSVRLGEGHFFSYDAYAVNGLGATTDLTQEAEPVRALRGNLLDLDRDKGLGARLAVRLFQTADVGALELGVSFYSGRVRATDALRYSALDVDLSLHLGPLTLLAEVAQSFLGAGGHAFDPFETGLYAQLAYQLGHFQLTARLDATLEKPMLAQDGTWRRALVPGLLYGPESFWSLRAEAAVPLDGGGEPTMFSMMAAFSF